ncbi:UvrD-helicase domain-containing protein [Shewanella japonica]|uniref:UvrD-helicase domain-containing protein n=1 Tax=Shewanella japonica TaxID=93973 RepID=UPI0024947322|nr:UvrD-helicase domain-containing protein [Shewanella japonica]
MDQPVMSPLNQIKNCIETGQSFVLQGGAGSGKTETLKRTVQFCAENHPEKKIVCITHTNKAVEEIINRVDSGYEISTIHSFLNTLIKPYKKNLLAVLPQLFCIPEFKRIDLDRYKGDEKVQKTEEHKRFKKSHEHLENLRFTVLSEKTEKVVGKRDYDKDPDKYNLILNTQVEELNTCIRQSIKQHHHSDVKYNETPFDSFKKATFGHDGLIQITSILFGKYPNLGKIVRDKYDCIFIDEYQDTDEEIIRSLIYDTPNESSITIGLFGDSEQAIYEDGIGSAKEIIDDGRLELIEKEDNFRCSPQVIKVANKFRKDGLEQKVAFKEVEGGLESDADRDGSAKLIYAFKPEKPKKPSSPSKKASDDEIEIYQTALEVYEQELDDYKVEYNRRLEALVTSAQEEIGSHVLLKLPNKSVARDANFGSLYSLFDARYSDTRKKMKQHLDQLQFGQLCEILKLFECSNKDKRAFNRLIIKLRGQGFLIKTRNDKKHLHTALDGLLNSDKSAYDVMIEAISLEVISISESHNTYLNRKSVELERIASEKYLKPFKALKNAGCKTKLKMLKYIDENKVTNISKEIIEDQFDERMRDILIENFYTSLFGGSLKFEEILAFYTYENDDSDFMTMHKTKGTGIENVVVVLDEFNWTKYDFSSCFEKNNSNPSRQALSRKLLYVACSRAKKNLICVRLLNDAEEVEKIQNYIEDCEEVTI